MAAEILHPMIESKMALLPTGDIQWEIGHAATMEDFQAGRVLWTRLALTPKQALQVADDLRQKAASSRQTPDAGTS